MERLARLHRRAGATLLRPPSPVPGKPHLRRVRPRAPSAFRLSLTPQPTRRFPRLPPVGLECLDPLVQLPRPTGQLTRDPYRRSASEGQLSTEPRGPPPSVKPAVSPPPKTRMPPPPPPLPPRLRLTSVRWGGWRRHPLILPCEGGCAWHREHRCGVADAHAGRLHGRAPRARRHGGSRRGPASCDGSRHA